DAPVSKVRATVRAGRDQMRAQMLSRLPDDLRGMRILDAGCGTGAMCEALAKRGADVVGVDISPSLIEIAAKRLPNGLKDQVTFEAGDMLARRGHFDAVMAMDSLIYYATADLTTALAQLLKSTDKVVFTLAPRTPFLMTFWYAGKLFPRKDRSPVMIPQDTRRLARDIAGLSELETVRSGFYTSKCLELVSTRPGHDEVYPAHDAGGPRTAGTNSANLVEVPGQARDAGGTK
ncbi:MAG: magnesium protoporphyrin IX methyltransferase, partial [Pseudomonadota bacterium]